MMDDDGKIGGAYPKIPAEARPYFSHNGGSRGDMNANISGVRKVMRGEVSVGCVTFIFMWWDPLFARSQSVLVEIKDSVDSTCKRTKLLRLVGFDPNQQD